MELSPARGSSVPVHFEDQNDGVKDDEKDETESLDSTESGDLVETKKRKRVLGEEGKPDFI